MIGLIHPAGLAAEAASFIRQSHQIILPKFGFTRSESILMLVSPSLVFRNGI